MLSKPLLSLQSDERFVPNPRRRGPLTSGHRYTEDNYDLAEFEAMAPEEGPLGWVVNQASKPGRDPRPTWIAQASDDWSTIHLEDEAEAVRRLLGEALRHLPPPPPAARAAAAESAPLPLPPLRVPSRERSGSALEEESVGRGEPVSHSPS